MKIDRRRSTPLLAVMRNPVLRWPWRIISIGMVAMQFVTCQAWLLGMLAFSIGPVSQAAAESVKSEASSPLPANVQAAANEMLLAQNTTVNRNVPVDLPVSLPTFSESPTAAETFAKGG